MFRLLRDQWWRSLFGFGPGGPTAIYRAADSVLVTAENRTIPRPQEILDYASRPGFDMHEQIGSVKSRTTGLGAVLPHAKAGIVTPAGSPHIQLVIKGIDRNSKELDLIRELTRFGHLKGVNYVRDDYGVKGGMAFVEYYSPGSAAPAIWHMHGMFLMKRDLVVKYFEEPFAPSKSGARNAPRFGVDVFTPGFDD